MTNQCLPFCLASLQAKSRLGIVDAPAMAWVPGQLKPGADIVSTCTGMYWSMFPADTWMSCISYYVSRLTFMLMHARRCPPTAGQFGDACRGTLMRYGKTIIEQQLVLERVADVAIDLTASSACIARATKAIKESSATADHEAQIANLFVAEAGQRMKANLAAINGSGGQNTINKLKYSVADKVFESAGYSAKHPIGF